MKFVLVVLLFLLSAFSSAQHLDTPNYTVTLEPLCALGHPSCQQLRYKGVSKVTGASIELTGSKFRSPCTQSGAGCGVGYQFNNGRIRYLVYQSGLLQVIGRSGRVLVEEQGMWLQSSGTAEAQHGAVTTQQKVK